MPDHPGAIVVAMRRTLTLILGVALFGILAAVVVASQGADDPAGTTDTVTERLGESVRVWPVTKKSVAAAATVGASLLAVMPIVANAAAMTVNPRKRGRNQRAVTCSPAAAASGMHSSSAGKM